MAAVSCKKTLHRLTSVDTGLLARTSAPSSIKGISFRFGNDTVNNIKRVIYNVFGDFFRQHVEHRRLRFDIFV
uniref:Uncharacterized protein n=1 Tax=Klebsiella pneumoniae TaxID=573 RepID=A0A8B0SS26_KLEPN|nr:hypothetical protein [Klebsiella pneumoniae]